MSRSVWFLYHENLLENHAAVQDRGLSHQGEVRGRDRGQNEPEAKAASPRQAEKEKRTQIQRLGILRKISGLLPTERSAQYRRDDEPLVQPNHHRAQQLRSHVLRQGVQHPAGGHQGEVQL